MLLVGTTGHSSAANFEIPDVSHLGQTQGTDQNAKCTNRNQHLHTRIIFVEKVLCAVYLQSSTPSTTDAKPCLGDNGP